MFSPMSHSVCYFSESADVAAMQGPSPNGTSNGHLGQGGSSESEPHAHDTTVRHVYFVILSVAVVVDMIICRIDSV